MYNRLRNRLDAGSQHGFTLIELLIVIIILGILAAIVVFAVGGITDRGTSAACKSDVKSLETAQEAYYAQNSVYAASAGALVTAKLIRSAPQTYTVANKYGVTTGTANSGGVIVTTATAPASDGTSASAITKCDSL